MTGATITVRHSGGTDRYGNPLPPPPDDIVADCLIAPRSSAETDNLGDLVDSRMVVYAPAGTTVVATDRLLLPGYVGEWQVAGDPNRWDLGGDSYIAGVEIVVRQVT